MIVAKSPKAMLAKPNAVFLAVVVNYLARRFSVKVSKVAGDNFNFHNKDLSKEMPRHLPSHIDKGNKGNGVKILVGCVVFNPTVIAATPANFKHRLTNAFAARASFLDNHVSEPFKQK